jgi:hypothetical protein
MLLSLRFPFLSNFVRPSSSRSRRPLKRRRDAARIGQPVCCGPAAETLEGRQMLSAASALTAVATPTFILEAHGAATNKPAVTAGTAPIDPAQMQAAYGINQISFNGVAGTGAGQTIAIVDAYNDPDIISDANSFSSEFGLPQFNGSSEPTLKVLNQTGGTSLPANAAKGGWDVEEALDVEWAHSIAPGANIILFEASSNSDANLFQAVDTAADYAGVSVVSMSWDGGESSSETGFDSNFVTPNGHQGVTFLAATGDDGTPSGYPAFSPDVVAVGGTTLDINSGQYIAEGAWSDTGGGISQYETIPSYQSSLNGVNGASTTHRNVPDVAMDADPNSGVYVLDSYDGGWFQVGGTSLATPMWGGLIAIANQGRSLLGESSLNGATQTLPTLYQLPSSDFHDITTGSNGTYSAGTGYDLVTGLGTPIANLLVPALAGYGTTQPPSVSAPASASLAENGSLTFSSANGNAISVTDASAGTNADSLTLSVSHGTLTLSTTSGLTFTSGSNDSSSFTVTGTVSSLDAALAGLVYQPTAGYAGSDSLAISVTDPGDSLSASASVSLSVNAPTPPTITAPSTATVAENSSLVFSTGKGNAITLTDASAGSGSDSLTLTVSNGILTLASTTGLTFTTGGNGTAAFTVTGTLSSLNAALNGLTYQPTAGYSGSDTLGISLSDPGDSLSDSDSIGLTVTAASAPAITAPTSGSLNENSSLTFSSTNGNAISVADSSAGSTDSLTLAVTHGTLTLASTSGLTITAGANGSSTVTVTGTIANLDAALNGLVYKPATNYSGSDSLSISISDPGDGLSASDSVTLTVNAAVAPTIKAPATASVAENGSVAFSKSITITDASAGTSTEKLTLTATHGTLRLGSTSGITITSGANRSASMTISGTLTNLNNALNGLTYTPTRNFTGSASISLSYTDAGDGLTGTGSIALTVSRNGRASRSLVVTPAPVQGDRQFVPLTGGATLSLTNPATTGGSADADTSTTIDAQTQWAGFLQALEFLIN